MKSIVMRVLFCVVALTDRQPACTIRTQTPEQKAAREEGGAGEAAKSKANQPRCPKKW